MKMKILMMLALILFPGVNLANATHYIVEDGDDYGTIDLVNSDTLLMTGGHIFGLNTYATSAASILDTNPMGPGNAGIDNLSVYDFSTIDFSGGSSWYFEGFDSCTINIDGGEIRYLITNDSATVHLSQGQISHLLGVRDNTSYVHIYGYDFDYDPSGGLYNDGLLTGYWPDNAPFNVSLINLSDLNVITYDQLIFHVIPEPATILLVGIGGLILSKRSKREEPTEAP